MKDIILILRFSKTIQNGSIKKKLYYCNLSSDCKKKIVSINTGRDIMKKNYLFRPLQMESYKCNCTQIYRM